MGVAPLLPLDDQCGIAPLLSHELDAEGEDFYPGIRGLKDPPPQQSTDWLLAPITISEQPARASRSLPADSFDFRIVGSTRPVPPEAKGVVSTFPPPSFCDLFKGGICFLSVRFPFFKDGCSRPVAPDSSKCHLTKDRR